MQNKKMKSVNTCNMQKYSPLIPAIIAYCDAQAGEVVKIVLDDASAFNDLKEFLAEQHIGFREIYDGEHMTLQFTK